MGEMSPFDQYVRDRLGTKNAAWPREWDGCLEEARPALEELRRKGGDDRFALFVLANYRWRQVVPLGSLRERESLIHQIDQLLGNQSVWFRYVQQSGREAWKAAEEELRSAKSRLLAIHPHDMSAFEATHTDWMTEGPHWQSNHSYTCLWALHWHLQQIPGVRRIRRRLLAGLLFPFGFLGHSRDPELLVAQRLRRNPRSRKENRFIRNFTLAHLIRMYHHAHREAKGECGPVCKAWPEILRFNPPVKARGLAEKAMSCEHRGQHARAARCYEQALDEAEKVLGPDHSYVAWILVRYWLALRHAGQHAKAARIKPRADAMWVQHGAGPLSA